MPQKRSFRPRARRSGVRDAKLVVIAAEGQKTEKVYFDDLAYTFHNPRIHVEVLERLNSFRRQYKLRPDYDQLWLVLDVDRWGERKLLMLLGSYNKSAPDTSVFLPHVQLAIGRAKNLDLHPEHRWPNDLGSRVYLLAEVILER